MTDNDERSVLLRFLESQRAHIVGAMEGLSDQELRRPVLPSGWTCLGLLKHLAVSDERYWFTTVVGGAPLDFPQGPNADWQVGADEPAADVFALYRSEIDRANDAIATTALDDPPRWCDPWWEQAGLSFPNLRYILGHVIVETSIHAGHLDAARELIDGKQWVVL